MKIEEEKLKKGAILEKKRRFDQLKFVYKLLNHVPTNGVATGEENVWTSRYQRIRKR